MHAPASLRARAATRLVRHPLQLFLLGAAALCTLSSQAQDPIAMPATAMRMEQGRPVLNYEKVRLANGLELILAPDRRLPLVSVNLWVHAGPRNEAPGQTGFAHLFEHLMFAGSRHIPRGAMDRIIDAAGGTDANGTTDFDRTNYFVTLPSNQLELGLWLKSDMLGYMIDKIDAVALSNQQDVVRNERRLSENRPYGVVEDVLFQALFPAGHPYRAAVIGSHADIQSIKLADVKDFARRYYRPNNATLVLAGDFDPTRAKALVQKYFGPLRQGLPVPPAQATQPRIEQEQRLSVTDRVELPRLTLAWHTPAVFKPSDAELDLAARVLAGGASSRLQQRLVRELRLAQSVSASQASLSLGSLFSMEVLAMPGQSLADIEAVINAEIQSLAEQGPSQAELAQARTAVQTQLMQQLEKPHTLADLLNYYNQQAGDPGYLAQDLQRYQDATVESVKAAVAQYLGRNHRVVVQALPGPQQLAAEIPTPPPPKASKAAAESINPPAPWRKQQPPASGALDLQLPTAQRRTLPNGLELIHVHRPGLPLASVVLAVRAGQSANPQGLPGLHAFTAAMLTEGSQQRSAQDIAAEAARLGLVLQTTPRDDDTLISFSGLSRHFGPGLALLADVALHPAFASTDVQRLRTSQLTALGQLREDPNTLVSVVGRRAAFGPQHPLGQSPLGTEASIKAIDSEALRGFWQGHYRPDQAALVVVGDVDPNTLRQQVDALFGAWQRPDTPLPQRSRVPAQATQARVVVVDKPGAPQTALSVVTPLPPAGMPDAAALNVGNAAMGGLFTSRINHLLREVKGYTYGLYTQTQQGREIGLFSTRGSVRTDATADAIALFLREVRDMRAQPMPGPELQRVRNALLLALPGELDTHQALATHLASDWARDLPADELKQLPQRLRQVSAASAQAALRAHIDPTHLIFVGVGDWAQLQPQLEQLRARQPQLRLERWSADGPATP
ncbi:M16 family metallopeptidase [Roseateles sp. BYS180W]|uniref:M16 family metallopeptidase n=1 Tax=Roseateles rivi TaxID=3299028 RepID=A0ABW7FTA1_9BURK